MEFNFTHKFEKGNDYGAFVAIRDKDTTVEEGFFFVGVNCYEALILYAKRQRPPVGINMIIEIDTGFNRSHIFIDTPDNNNHHQDFFDDMYPKAFDIYESFIKKFAPHLPPIDLLNSSSGTIYRELPSRPSKHLKGLFEALKGEGHIPSDYFL